MILSTIQAYKQGAEGTASPGQILHKVNMTTLAAEKVTVALGRALETYKSIANTPL